MLEQQRFRGNGANSTGTQEFRAGDEQMDRHDEQIAHGSNVITLANRCKTALYGLLELIFTNSPPTRDLEFV